MAYQFTSSVSRLSGGVRVGLAVLLLGSLAVPLFYLAWSPAAQALAPEEDPFAGEPVPAAEADPFAEPPTAVAATPVPLAASLEYAPLPTASEKRIAAELEQPTEMDFQECPLRNVVDYLKERHAIEIRLDYKALTDAGIDPETPVTTTIKGITLRSALHLLWAPLDLTTIIEDEVMLITTAEKASACLVTRIYPVGDLVKDDDYTDLTEALTRTVRPTSWEKGGGDGRWSTVKSLKSLVISQTREVHDEILQLLRALRTVSRATAVAGRSK